jgi:hypothetical protein
LSIIGLFRYDFYFVVLGHGSIEVYLNFWSGFVRFF